MSEKLLTLVINLKSSTERLHAVSKGLDAANMRWSRVDAVDFRGRSPHEVDTYDSRACHIRHDGDLTGGEMGCVLSHHAALRQFLETDAEYALILEDDAIIESDLPDKLNSVIAAVNVASDHRWQAIYLLATSKGYDQIIVDLRTFALYRDAFVPCAAGAILWSRRGAESFLKSHLAIAISGPIDRDFRSHFARTGLAFKTVPPMLDRRDVPSDIDPARTERFGGQGRPVRSSHRSRVRRHFPDYFHAWLQTLSWKWRDLWARGKPQGEP